MREQFANNATTTLDSAIDNSQTSIDVVDGSVFPSTGNFRLIVDSEYMLCTARSSNTLTVVRGIEGSTAAAHIAGAAVSHILTAGSLVTAVADNVPWGNTTRPGFGYTPSVSAFTVGNTAGSSFTDMNGYIHIRKPAHNGESVTALLQAQAAPYTVDIAFQWVATGSEPNAGILAHDSNTGRILYCAIDQHNDIAKIVGWRYNNFTSFNGTSFTRRAITPLSVYWMRLENDGSDLTFSVSCDGINWLTIFSDSIGTFVTPDSVGFGVANIGSTNLDCLVTLLAFHVH